jgi:hypothetical protein
MPQDSVLDIDKFAEAAIPQHEILRYESGNAPYTANTVTCRLYGYQTGIVHHYTGIKK